MPNTFHTVRARRDGYRVICGATSKGYLAKPPPESRDIVCPGCGEVARRRRRPMSVAVYQRRNVRLRCGACRGWMARCPTPRSPLERAPAPFAGLCVGCAAPMLEKAGYTIANARVVGYPQSVGMIQ